jgi:hypothetical protein
MNLKFQRRFRLWKSRHQLRLQIQRQMQVTPHHPQLHQLHLHQLRQLVRRLALLPVHVQVVHVQATTHLLLRRGHHERAIIHFLLAVPDHVRVAE